MSAASDPGIDPDDGPLAPIANPLLAGHESAERELMAAFNGGRMAHAWLMTGPKGIGKATLAYRFARYVLSAGGGADGAPGLFGEAPPEASADEGMYVAPDHPVFRRIAAGGHGDLRVVERGTNDSGNLRNDIVIDDVRGVGTFLSLTASEGGWRVVIIDSADDMNRNAANAILKVLEEPPRKSLLLLVSHNPGRLLPTIRSRCRRLTLASLEAADVENLLAGFCPHLSTDEARELSELGQGSIGKALALAEGDGLAIHRDVRELLSGLPALDLTGVYDFAEKMARKGAGGRFETAVDVLRSALATIVRAAACEGGGHRGGEATGQAAEIERLAGAAPLDRWLQVWEKVDVLLERVTAVNLDRKQIFVSAFLEIESAVNRR